jgi:hypothetical protein
MPRAYILVMAMLLLTAAPSAAQIEQCTRYKDLIDAVAAGKDPNAAENLMNVSLAPRCFALFVAGLDRADRSAFRDFVRRFEGRRADKQTGASAGGEGSTSVVAQGPVAKILSVAAEYGALTQTVNGQVVTVRGNLAGVPSLLVNKEVFPYCIGEESSGGYCVDRSLIGVLKRFSFGVSFDASRAQVLTAEHKESAPPAGESGPVTFTGKSREISSISVRAELWNHRDVSTPEFANAWREKVGSAMDAASADLLRAGEFANEVISLPIHDAWFKTSVAAVRAAGRDRAQIVAALTSSLNLLVTQAKTLPGFDERVADALAAYSRFFLAQDDLIASLATKNVLAFEYANTRPAVQPATSNYRVIFDYPISKETKIVANGAATFYDSVPPGQTIVKRYRDAQVGVQLDQGLGDVAILGPAVFTLAGYFQYQHSPALLNVDPSAPVTGVAFIGLPEGAKEVFATTGNIWLVQGKLSLVPSDSSIKIPLSVTWSNRTELIDKPTWRGQIGISYDLDSIFGVLSGR